MFLKEQIRQIKLRGSATGNNYHKMS